jgi:RNA polymerase sigma-70 factor, ECF subfamily
MGGRRQAKRRKADAMEPSSSLPHPPSLTPHDVLRSVWDDAATELARLVGALGVRSSRAEDLLQEVYLTAWQKAPAGLDGPDLRRWLFRVTANRCHLEHRRHARWQGVFRGLTRLLGRSQELDPAQRVGKDEETALVRRALERLDPPVRSILVLRYFTGLDSAEIGRILELPDSTVRSHLRAAREKLAVELRRAGYHHE